MSGWAQRDDFNDGDDADWTRYDPIEDSGFFPGVGSWTFPNGNSYRIQTEVSPLPGTVGPGRAGSLRTDVTYTDFYVTVDIVNWATNLDQAIGLLARISDVGLGTTDGYALTYQVADGDIDITRFSNEDPADGELTLDGSDVVNMVPGRSYRYVFIGRGSTLIARVYELPMGRFPIVDVSAMDSAYSSGYCGLLNFDNSGGGGTTDATYDNYLALDREPPVVDISWEPGFGDLFVSWPTNAPNYILQAADSLDDPTNWVEIPRDLYSVFDDRYIYSADSGAPTPVVPVRFYRLVLPP